MRTKLCMAIVIACLAVASEAAAQLCTIERIESVSAGQGASADFSSVDTSTCALGIETTVHVDASQGLVTVEDACGRHGVNGTTVTTTETNAVAIFVSVYDRCLATRLLSVTGVGEAEEFHVSNNFKTASVRAAFEGVDDFNQSVSIAIDLVWTGVGQKEHTGDHVSDNRGTFRYTSHGTIRDAVAAGSVVIDGTDRAPLPSPQGTIERDASRALEAYR